MEKKKRIKELRKEIRYENKRMECCGYGGSDLRYLWSLEKELEELLNEEEE